MDVRLSCNDYRFQSPNLATLLTNVTCNDDINNESGYLHILRCPHLRTTQCVTGEIIAVECGELTMCVVDELCVCVCACLSVSFEARKSTI